MNAYLQKHNLQPGTDVIKLSTLQQSFNFSCNDFTYNDNTFITLNSGVITYNAITYSLLYIGWEETKPSNIWQHPY
jgi:hypothetical protein